MDHSGFQIHFLESVDPMAFVISKVTVHMGLHILILYKSLLVSIHCELTVSNINGTIHLKNSCVVVNMELCVFLEVEDGAIRVITASLPLMVVLELFLGVLMLGK